MSRLLFFAVIVVIVYWLFNSYRKQPSDDNIAVEAQDMVCCAHCGLNLPKEESILDKGAYFCSEAHQLEHLDASE